MEIEPSKQGLDTVIYIYYNINNKIYLKITDYFINIFYL